MTTITAQRKLARRGDIVMVPRKEYEALTALRKAVEFVPTAAQRRALGKAEQNLKASKTLSYHDLVQKLGSAS